MNQRSPFVKRAQLALLLIAGISGIAALSAVGWDIRHDHVLLQSHGDFQLTPKEWRSFARELIAYSLGAIGFVLVCAVFLRVRFGLPGAQAFVQLLGAFSLGWLSAFYAAGCLIPLDHDLAQLAWIGVAAACAGLFAFQLSSLATRKPKDKEALPSTVILDGGNGSSKGWIVLAATLATLYVITFAFLSVLRHNAFGTDLHDLGLYDQMLWNTLRGRLFHCSLWQLSPNPDVFGPYDLKRFGYNFLAEHFMPVLLVLAPLYALWQDPRTLLIVQSAALGLAALPLYHLTSRILTSRSLAFLFAFAFLMNPLIGQTNIKDFHADAFEPLFFFAAIAALTARRFWLYWPALLLFLACKEDVSLTVMALGAFLVWRERRPRLGLATVVVGAVWYLVAVKGIMAPLRQGEPLRHLYRYTHLLPPGEEQGLAGIARTLFLNPLYVGWVSLDGGHLASLLRLFLPVAAMPLLAPSTVLFYLPALAANLLSNWDTQYLLDLHYSIAIVGPLYVAAACGARNWLFPQRAREPFFQPPAADAAAPNAERRCSPLCPRAAAMTVFILLAVGLLARQYGRFPGGGNHDKNDYFPNRRARQHQLLAHTYMAAIPRDAALSAHSPIGAHLTARQWIFVFPEIENARYILVDTRDDAWPFRSRQAFEQRVRQLLADGKWGAVRPYEDGFLLLEKGAGASRNPRVLQQLNFTPYR